MHFNQNHIDKHPLNKLKSISIAAKVFEQFIRTDKFFDK